jgi:hypothetical protein
LGIKSPPNFLGVRKDGQGGITTPSQRAEDEILNKEQVDVKRCDEDVGHVILPAQKLQQVLTHALAPPIAPTGYDLALSLRKPIAEELVLLCAGERPVNQRPNSIARR